MAAHGSARTLWAVELYAVGVAWLLFVLALALRAGLADRGARAIVRTGLRTAQATFR